MMCHGTSVRLGMLPNAAPSLIAIQFFYGFSPRRQRECATSGSTMPGDANKTEFLHGRSSVLAWILLLTRVTQPRPPYRH